MKYVLVVEDDQDIQVIYKEALSEAGFDVMIVDDAEHAYHSILGKKPDVILLDIMLPGKMNGLELLEKLKVDERTKEIPVIIATNLDSEEKVARQIGAADYLIKAENPPNKVVEVVKKHTNLFSKIL